MLNKSYVFYFEFTKQILDFAHAEKMPAPQTLKLSARKISEVTASKSPAVLDTWVMIRKIHSKIHASSLQNTMNLGHDGWNVFRSILT